MCLQCSTEAFSYGFPLDGFALMRASRSDPDWQKDQLGLVECNDPTFILTTEPMIDPLFGRLDASDQEYTDHEEQIDKLWAAAEQFESDICGSCRLDAIRRLFHAASQTGYVSDRHGRLSLWLSHYLASWITTHPPLIENKRIINL